MKANISVDGVMVSGIVMMTHLISNLPNHCATLIIDI